MAFFNINDYQTVQERLNLFWELHPEGRLSADLVFSDGKQYIVKTEVYLHNADPHPATVDYAEETVSVKGVNATSALENCVTSSYGRSLALLGTVFSPSGKKPSREEMAKVQRVQPKATNDTAEAFKARVEALTASKDLSGLRELYKTAVSEQREPSHLALVSIAAESLKPTPPKTESAASGTKSPAK
jgi:hypothetical protein